MDAAVAGGDAARCAVFLIQTIVLSHTTPRRGRDRERTLPERRCPGYQEVRGVTVSRAGERVPFNTNQRLSPSLYRE